MCYVCESRRFVSKCRASRLCHLFFFLMIRRPPRSTLDRSSAASDVYKRQHQIVGDEFAVDGGAKDLGFDQAEAGPQYLGHAEGCLLYTSPSPRDRTRSRMPSSA